MKTIIIRNGLFWSGLQKFRVVVNGEEHIMKTQLMNVDIVENESFEIKIKRGWRYSPAYSFEPKDNVLIQISENRQIRKRYILLGLLGLVLFSLIGYFFEIRWLFSFSPALMFLFPAIYMIIMRKSFFVVQEKLIYNKMSGKMKF